MDISKQFEKALTDFEKDETERSKINDLSRELIKSSDLFNS